METFSYDGYQIIHPNDRGILYERRQILRLTQKEVAERAGISQQAYHRFESGERKLKNASFQTACKILEALELDIADYYHDKYILGEPLKDSPEGPRYTSTGRLISDTIDD